MIFFILLFLLFFAPKIYAIDAFVKISNFSSNSSPEWVELNNTTENTINIDNWLIKDDNNDSSDDLILSGCLSPFSYQTFYHKSGWLNNDHDVIYLLDANRQSIDSLIYSVGKIELTPRSTNICVPTLTPEPTPTILISPEPTNIIPSPTIFINPLIITEIMANPETDQDEWIEIYNPGADTISLKNICFYDASNHSRCFADTDIIAPKSYFSHNISSGFLNNDGDTVNFLNLSIIYPKSPKNYTYSRQENNSWCFSGPTQNIKNSDCLSISTSSSNDENYSAPDLKLQFIPDSVSAGTDFNLVFSMNSADQYFLRLTYPFGSQYFPFTDYHDGYSWLTMPLSTSKKLPPGSYPLSFHLKKNGSSHLYDYQLGNLIVSKFIETKTSVSKNKILGAVATPIISTCPPQITSLAISSPDLIFFSWPFLFAGSILFLSPILFPKLYSV